MITPFYSFTPSQRSLCVAPNSIPSNDCFILILSYASGRSEAIKVHEFNRINRVTNKLLKRPHIINAFNRSTQKITINTQMDPTVFVNKINSLGQLYSIKLTINIKVSSMRSALDQNQAISSGIFNTSSCNSSPSSNESMDSEFHDQRLSKQEQAISGLLTSFEGLGALILNYQNITAPIRIDESLQLSKNLTKVKIGFSVLDFSLLVFMTKLQGLTQLTVHDSSFINSNLIFDSDLNGNTNVGVQNVDYKIQPNFSLQSICLYKNKMPDGDQLAFMQQIIPKMRRLKSLAVPSNNFKNDEIGQSLHEYLMVQAREVGLSELNFGNNFFSPDCLFQLCEAACCNIPTLKKLVIAFSSLGEGESYIGDKFCELMKYNKSITNLDVQCCNLTLANLMTLQKAISENTDSSLTDIKLGLNQFTDKEFRDLFIKLQQEQLETPLTSDLAGESYESDENLDQLMKK